MIPSCDYLSDSVFTEYYDEDTLRRCISYLIIERKFEREGKELNSNPQAYFKYLESGVNGAVKIVYKAGNGDRFGLYRKYANCDDLAACGACHFMREIRAALFSERYIDLDIVNAYPNFMYAITKGPFLGEYITNRDQHLKEVMNSCHVSRDIAKQLFLMIGFGGNYRTWYSDHAKNVQPTDFVMNYYTEMQASRKKIIDYFDKRKWSKEIDCVIRRKYRKVDGKIHKSTLKNIFIADSISKKLTREYDIDNSTISNCMQFLEVEIMKIVYKKLQDLGVDLSTCIYCFDGCMVLKSELEKLEYTPEMLTSAINEYLHSIEDFYIDLSGISFISKPFEQNDLNPANYPPTKFNTYAEYLNDQPQEMEFPEDSFKISVLQSLKQGDRTDRQVEYLNRYCVYDIDIAKIVLRTSIDKKLNIYSPQDFKAILTQAGCEYLFKSIQFASRKDDITKPKKWIYTEPSGDRYYNLFMGIRPDIMNGEYKEEIGNDFEEFVNTFGLGECDLDTRRSWESQELNIKEECLKWIQPLKNIIGILAAKAGTRVELCPCIVSIPGFGKDVLFDIITKWYDPSETAKTTIDGIVGNFNEDAGKCVVMVNECHDRSVDTVNKIKDLVTASEVVVNHKYGLKGAVTNKTTVFFFGNSTQGVPLEWETGERRGVFYNLMNVPLKFSKAKAFMEKWSKDPAFYSSCYHKACEWFDPSFDNHQNIITPSKTSMQDCNIPPIVDVIYRDIRPGQYTPSDLIDILKMYLEESEINCTMRSIRKKMIGYFGNNVCKKIHGERIIDLTNVRTLIEEKYRIPEKDRVGYCEF